MKKIITILLVLFIAGVLYGDKAPKYGDQEVVIGRQNVEEIAKNYKFSEDPVLIERVNRIGSELAKVANENKFTATYGSDVLTPFNYEFRVIDADDINAFSVMGGYIYVYKGMINFCESDDELAGVMAHEVIHAAHHHLVHLIDEQTKFNTQALVAIMVGIFASKGRADTIAGVATMSNLYQIAMVNGYSQDAERDADNGAFLLIQKTKYNPVGLLTPLERLAQSSELVDLGIYRSHPVNRERVLRMRKRLKDANIPIDRGAVSGKIKYEIKDETKAEIKVKSLYLDNKLILSIPVGDNEQSAIDRLNNIYNVINKAIGSNAEIFDIKCDNEAVIIKGQRVFTPIEEEASVTGLSVKDCVRNCYNILRTFLLKRDSSIIV